MKVLFKAAAVSVAFAAAFAASPVLAQAYGKYADHEVDYVTTLSADPNVKAITNNAWVNLTSMTQNGVAGITGTGGFPGTAAWTGKASQVNSSYGDVGAALGGATLGKVANGTGGGPYAASGSMYFGGFSGDVNNYGGTLAVTDTSPLAGLSSVVFQVGFGEAWTYDFHNDAAAVLNYTTASGSFAATLTSRDLLEAFYNGTVAMPTGDEAVYINQHAFTWDLSGVNEEITAFNISFTGVQHAQLYGLTLTQVAAVPEPETYAMMIAGLLGMGAIVRRRKGKQQA